MLAESSEDEEFYTPGGSMEEVSVLMTGTRALRVRVAEVFFIAHGY